MLSLDLARKLADAGFDWTPSERDTFIIPDAGMDHKIFVISELQASVYPYFGVQHIMFHGTSEWALDQVMVDDAVWLPSESQLRTAIEERTPDTPLYARTHERWLPLYHQRSSRRQHILPIGRRRLWHCAARTDRRDDQSSLIARCVHV